MTPAITLANNTNKPIQCLVLPAPNISVAELFTPHAIDQLIPERTFNTVGDLISHFATAGQGHWQYNFAHRIGHFFQQHGATVYPGEDLDVYNPSADNPLDYFNPSYAGATFSKGENITLLLRTDDGRFACTLAVEEGQCWVVQKQKVGYDVVRAADGHRWVPNADAGRVAFEPIILAEESTA